MFHFGEIEEGSETGTLSLSKLGVVVEEVKTEVDETSGGWLTVDEDVSLREMPASWPDKKLSNLVVELVNFVPCLVVKRNGPINSIFQVHLPSHQILPARRQCILKICLSTLNTQQRYQTVSKVINKDIKLAQK